ncbi:MAG: ABC transporter ATP-binding protein [Myxococcales bacterium]
MTALLEAVALSRSFGATKALDTVSLGLHSGELLGLVGPDGAGKSTLLRAMMGLIAIDAGEARVLGVRWEKAPADSRERLGYMPQHYGLYTDLSVDENLRFFASLFDIPKDLFQERRARLLALMQLERAADRPAGALSGGMYKKLAIACALLHRPQALVLDEPTNGVDPVSRRELWGLLYEFVNDGMGVLVSTPYMDEAARCSRVALLHQGHLLAHGEPAALVAGFAHDVIEVEGTDRRALEPFLEAQDGVVALTPAGERLRVVVRREVRQQVEGQLRAMGARVVEGRADFEDLYLSLVASRGAA